MKKFLLSICLLLGVAGAQAQNPYPLIPLDSAQRVSDAKLALTPPNDSPDYVAPMKNLVYRDTVKFDGYVIFDPRFYGLAGAPKSRVATYLAKDTIARPWEGIQIMCDPSGISPNLSTLVNANKFFDNLKFGLKVRYTGLMRAFQQENQVNALAPNPNWDNSIQILDLTPRTIRPAVITIDSVMSGNVNTGAVQLKQIGEKWEGVYVQINNVTVLTNTYASNRYTWSVIDSKGNELGIRDFSGFFRNDASTDSALSTWRTFTAPGIGSNLAYIRGVITEFTASGAQRYFISPLYPSDIGPATSTPPQLVSKTRIPTLVTSADSVFITVKVKQGSANISNVKLFSAAFTSPTFDSITMTRNVLPNDTMVWFAKIKPYPNGTVVKNYVRIRDIGGSVVYSPDSFATGSAYWVKDGGPKTIKDLQFSPFANNATVWNNDSLTGLSIPAIVTSTNMTQGSGSSLVDIMTAQVGTGNDSNNAIIINRNRTNDNLGSLKVGDSIYLNSFLIKESFGQTTLNSVYATKTTSGNALPSFKTNLPIDTISAITAVASQRYRLTPFEGMLLKYNNVSVVNTNADGASNSNFGEFLINTDSTKTNGLRVDDISTTLPDLFNNNLRVKQKMKLAQGVLYLSFSNWKLEPRDSNDLDFSDILDTIAPVITLLGKNPDSLKVKTSYIEPGVTVVDNVDPLINLTLTRTSNIDSSKIGTYSIVYTAKDKAGNMASKTRTVVVYQATGINTNEFTSVLTNLFPNPATNELNVTASGVKTFPTEIALFDLSGRKLQSSSYSTKDINHHFDLSQLDNGIYFCNISNANGSKTIKFVVAK